MPRRDLVIATKAGSVPDPDRRFDGSRGHLLAALDASLERLGTDHVDLWQVHAFDPETPLDETLQALDIAVSSGRARYVGVSNFCGWQLAKAATWQLAAPGARTRLASTQMEYSLLQRGVEREVLPAALDLGIGLLPSSPLGRGRAHRQVPPRARRAGLAGRLRAAGAVRRARTWTRRPSRIVDAVAIAADGLAHHPAAGGAGLGTRPARAWPRRSSARGRHSSSRRRCQWRRLVFLTRSARRWTMCRRPCTATPTRTGARCDTDRSEDESARTPVRPADDPRTRPRTRPSPGERTDPRAAHGRRSSERHRGERRLRGRVRRAVRQDGYGRAAAGRLLSPRPTAAPCGRWERRTRRRVVLPPAPSRRPAADPAAAERQARRLRPPARRGRGGDRPRSPSRDERAGAAGCLTEGVRPPKRWAARRAPRCCARCDVGARGELLRADPWQLLAVAGRAARAGRRFRPRPAGRGSGPGRRTAGGRRWSSGCWSARPWRATRRWSRRR